jgi:hypothetical protein
VSGVSVSVSPTASDLGTVANQTDSREAAVPTTSRARNQGILRALVARNTADPSLMTAAMVGSG